MECTNCNQFNEKYKCYLEKSYYGLAIQDEMVVKYLDDIFTNCLIPAYPNFKYYQIKLKFGRVVFYCTPDIPKTLVSSLEESMQLLIDR